MTVVESKSTVAKGRIQLFASSPSDPRARRAVDLVRAVAQVLVMVLAAFFADTAADLDESLSAVLRSLPGFLKVLWLTAYWLAIGWSLALLIIPLFRHRARLTGEAIVAGIIATAVAVVAAKIVADAAGDVLSAFIDSNGPPVFPPAAPTVTAAVLATMAPFLTLPFRRFGRALVAAQMIGALCLGVSRGFGVIAALAIGLLAGSLVHIIFGSPGGLPTVSRVRQSLLDLGLEVQDLVPTRIHREGVVVLAGRDPEGDVSVKVYGRDAWEGEMLASAWRMVWYRGSQRTSRLSRSEYVEHEGFMSYLAANAGLRTPEVITAGLADNGDAMIAVRPDGVALDVQPTVLTDAQIASLWGDLRRLHDRGITHRQLDLDRVVTRGDGTVGFSDLSSASVRSNDEDKLADRAQLLALTILTSGQDAALPAARTALGDDGLTAVIPYVQEAALPPFTRSAVRKSHVELDGVRKVMATDLEAPDTELVKLRRVTWKSLLNVVLLAVAAYTIIGLIADIDFDAFGRALRNADYWWLLAALLVGQLPRVSNAVSTMGSTTEDLPLGPTTALHFATCYVNLAVPSSAGRVAIITRYFQRFGIPAPTALTAGVIDSLSEFVVQIVLFSLVFFASDIDLGINFSTSQLSGLATTAFVIVGALVVALVIAILVPSLRQRLVVAIRQARDALAVLRTPRKLIELFGGNMLSQLFFAMTLGAAARGFGYVIPLSSLILINTVVGLFAGLLPIPGGVGVSEAGLALGLTRAGVPSDTAFAIALANRFCTFYLPPLWGYASYRWLVRHRYL